MTGTRPDEQRPSDLVRSRDGWVAVGYFAVYMALQFWRPENELAHWGTLVAAPFLLAWLLLPGDRSLATAAASVGLRRGGLMKGVGWAVGLGTLVTIYQGVAGGRAEQIQALIRTGQALWLFPLTLVLMMAMAGFTEELFFRGFLQTRLEALLTRRWGALVVTALLFGVYHVPYALLNPNWPSYGDWGDAWVTAMAEGVPGGLLLGALYVATRGNVLACVVLHSMINAAPAMTMISFGGG